RVPRRRPTRRSSDLSPVGGGDRASDPATDRSIRRRAWGGAGVSEHEPHAPGQEGGVALETGAPVRRSGPPGEGTLKDLSRPGRRGFSLPVDRKSTRL